MTIQKEFTEHKQNVLENQAKGSDVEGLKPVFHLSKEGKNVVVLFLDRAINAYFPYALEQIPELREQLDGFVYYPNTVSFGTDTLYGAPAMMGGYEYTPGEINKRDNEKLVDKHNEATLVLPKLFLDAGYSVTVTDPPFCNYKWEGDYTPFKPYPEIKVMNIQGKYAVQYKKDFSDVLDWNTNAESKIIKKRLPMFSLMKALAPLLRKTIYDTGRYFLVDENSQDIDIFLNSYSTLYYLDSITDYTAEGNTYTFIDNQTAHSPVFLQAPEYEPRSRVTDISTPFDEMTRLSEKDIATYHVYVAALKRIGIWLEKLKKDGMYDNTRIFIVADHGKDLFNPLFKDFDNAMNDYSRYNPLLLVKDFNSKDRLRTDSTFMTNADLPQLAIENLEVSKVNPFTGKNLLESVQKQKVQVYTGSWDPKKNLGTQFSFDYSRSFTVHDDISIETNWSPIIVK
ncbi:sulfatase-like hydrolase/transferase [Sphaerochaeta pleomorpha]|nr:sulfatase-like hydrolase/transferase [Sphaerochaeta pleomorpha]